MCSSKKIMLVKKELKTPCFQASKLAAWNVDATPITVIIGVVVRALHTGSEVKLEVNGARSDAKPSASAEDNTETSGPLTTSARSLGRGSGGGSRRSLEAEGGPWQPPGGPSTSARSLGAVSTGASSTGSRRSLEAGRKHAGPTLQAPQFVIPAGQLVGICGEVRPIFFCVQN